MRVAAAPHPGTLVYRGSAKRTVLVTSFGCPNSQVLGPRRDWAPAVFLKGVLGRARHIVAELIRRRASRASRLYPYLLCWGSCVVISETPGVRQREVGLAEGAHESLASCPLLGASAATP